MTATLVNVRSKKVPTLYESDESKYVGPHRWQIQMWARAVRRLMRQRAYTRWVEAACEDIEIVGLDHLKDLDGPAVFVANHQSHLDTLVTHAALPEAIRRKIYFGAAQDRWFIRGRKKLTLKPWYQSLVLGNFPILRGGGKRALSYAAWLLGKRQHVFLFPEGTRATGNELGEFKHGATLLAMQMGVPIVPVHLGGLQSMRAKGQREVTRGTASVEFLKPIVFSPGSDVAAATELVRNRLNRVHAARQTQTAEVSAAHAPGTISQAA
jgi:1-acyl-sn-glycerol-3-phosphate acyltransferase